MSFTPPPPPHTSPSSATTVHNFADNWMHFCKESIPVGCVPPAFLIWGVGWSAQAEGLPNPLEADFPCRQTPRGLPIPPTLVGNPLPWMQVGGGRVISCAGPKEDARCQTNLFVQNGCSLKPNIKQAEPTCPSRRMLFILNMMSPLPGTLVVVFLFWEKRRLSRRGWCHGMKITW